MLAKRMREANADCWLVNTGWVGGKYGSGSRCSLKYTRAIVDAIHNGSLGALDASDYENFDVFNLSIPTKVDNVPSEILDPRKAWPDKDAFNKELKKLAAMFQRAFHVFEKDVDPKVKHAGPRLHHH